MDPGVPPPQEKTTPALTPEAGASPARRGWLNILAVVAGLTALVLGPLAGGLFTLLSLMGGQGSDAVSITVIGLSMAALGLGFGGVLAWAGYEGLRGRSSRPFRPGPKWFWMCLAGLALVLIIGQVVLSVGLLAPVTFPLFHILGMTLPAVIILVLVGQGLKPVSPAPTQRHVFGQMAWGAFGATVFAFTLEAVVIVIGLIGLGVAIALTPGGPVQLAKLQALLSNPARLHDLETLAPWLLKPEIILSVTAMVAVFVPLIEEGAKSIAVPLLAWGAGKKPSPAQGWMWGVAAGAGFAITEGMFNAAASLPFWAGIALLRAGATAMHVATAGLTGLGWAHSLASRRPLPLLGSYLASVTLHCLWNGFTLLIVFSSLWMMAHPGDPAGVTRGGIGIFIGVVGMVTLMVTIVGVASYVTIHLRRSSVEIHQS
jgi:RsiW-degrading membrane proteinase PrsW (M82 family)